MLATALKKKKKEQLRLKMMLKRSNGKQFPSFPPRWVKDFMKKENAYSGVYVKFRSLHSLL